MVLEHGNLRQTQLHEELCHSVDLWCRLGGGGGGGCDEASVTVLRYTKILTLKIERMKLAI